MSHFDLFSQVAQHSQHDKSKRKFPSDDRHHPSTSSYGKVLPMKVLAAGYSLFSSALMLTEASAKNLPPESTQKAIIDKFQTAPNRRSHSSEVGHRCRLGGGPLTCLLTQPPISCVGTIIWIYGKVKKQPILEMVDRFDNFGRQKHCCRSWRSIFCPAIGPVGTDCDRIRILSGDLSASSPTYIYWGVGNCLVV